MGLESKVSELIIRKYSEALKEHLALDVAIVGGGPSGLVCAYYLARGGAKGAVFESKYSPGGGIWGGGMGYSVIALQKDLKPILDDFNIIYEEENGLLAVDSVVAGGCLISRAARYARVFNGVVCEDIMVKDGKVCGIVVNSAAIRAGGFHIDPLSIEARVVVDATGHDAVVSHLVERHFGKKLVMGQKAMAAEEAEEFVVERTGKLVEGVYVCGMAVGAVFGGPRMGPIFGGMIASGKRCAELILERLYK
jgi:thiamine thiazole synthase